MERSIFSTDPFILSKIGTIIKVNNNIVVKIEVNTEKTIRLLFLYTIVQAKNIIVIINIKKNNVCERIGFVMYGT